MYVPTFFLKQKFAMTTNRYELYAANQDGTFGQLMGFAEQKRLAFKEQVTFYTDPGKTRPVFSFKARAVMKLNAGYDIFDEAGNQIGFFRKDFGASLMRSTFHIEGPGFAGRGQEHDEAVPTSPVHRHPVPADPLRLRDARGVSRRRGSSGRARCRQVHRARSSTRGSTSASRQRWRWASTR